MSWGAKSPPVGNYGSSRLPVAVWGEDCRDSRTGEGAEVRGAVGFWVDVEGERSRIGWVESAERVREREEETQVEDESRVLAQQGWVKVLPSTERDSWFGGPLRRLLLPDYSSVALGQGAEPGAVTTWVQAMLSFSNCASKNLKVHRGRTLAAKMVVRMGTGRQGSLTLARSGGST